MLRDVYQSSTPFSLFQDHLTRDDFHSGTGGRAMNFGTRPSNIETPNDDWISE